MADPAMPDESRSLPRIRNEVELCGACTMYLR